MKTIYGNCKHWVILLILLVWTPIKGWTQTNGFEMVVEKIDGTELTFTITDDLWLGYHYGGDPMYGEDGVNTLEIQTVDGKTSVPCPEIKRLFTRPVTLIDDIQDINVNEGSYQIYTPDGKFVDTLQKGVNIIRYSDGTSKKVYVK